MWRQLDIRAYDALDHVVVYARLFEDGPDGDVVELLGVGAQFAGKGEPDPHDWIRDALVALLENL